MDKKSKVERNLDDAILKALEKAPKVEGFTIKQLAERVDSPWPTTRWHLELLEARGQVDCFEVGRAKIYYLKNKSE